jgi:uncharacterized repeat protein (TIGR04138 family)
MRRDQQQKIALLMGEESRYSAAAYEFVLHAVSYTTEQLPVSRHLCAMELLEGMRLFARREYGAVSGEVLYSWGIHSAADVGRIVYLLIGVELLSASEGDREEDFHVDFDFSAQWGEPVSTMPKAPIIC